MVQVDSLELVSVTYRVGQVGTWLEQSMGEEEVLGLLHHPE